MRSTAQPERRCATASSAVFEVVASASRSECKFDASLSLPRIAWCRPTATRWSGRTTSSTHGLFAFPSVCIGTNAPAVTGASNRTRRSRVNRTAPRRSEPRVRRCCFVADWEPSQRLLLRRAGDAEQQCGEAGIGLPRWLIFRASGSLGSFLRGAQLVRRGLCPGRLLFSGSGRVPRVYRCDPWVAEAGRRGAGPRARGAIVRTRRARIRVARSAASSVAACCCSQSRGISFAPFPWLGVGSGSGHVL